MSKLLADNFYIKYNEGIKFLNEKKYKDAKESLYNAFDVLIELSTDKTYKEEELVEVGEKLLSLIRKINDKLIKENDDEVDNDNKIENKNIENEVEVKDEEVSINEAVDKALENSIENNSDTLNNEQFDSNELFKDAAFKFNWDSLPIINFDDIAGLDEIKTEVKTKVLLPLKNPDAYKGYVKKSGGGLFLYGPPGTGKTMIAAAIANEIGAKFCSVKPSDLLQIGVGNTEKAVRELFLQARSFPCSVIYFDEMDSIAVKNTKSSISKQLRSELLAQLQGIESYGEDNGHILFLIAATNKPWDVDSAFVRPGRFGTKIYVGLPDEEARKYLVTKRFNKIKEKGVVSIGDEINIDEIVALTTGFNGADISNLLDSIEDSSIIRCLNKEEKTINKDDIENAFKKVHSSVQQDDLDKLNEWTKNNNS